MTLSRAPIEGPVPYAPFACGCGSGAPQSGGSVWQFLHRHTPLEAPGLSPDEAEAVEGPRPHGLHIIRCTAAGWSLLSLGGSATKAAKQARLVAVPLSCTGLRTARRRGPVGSTNPPRMLPSSENRVRIRPVTALVGNLASLDHSAHRHAHLRSSIAEREKVSRPLAKLMLGDRFHQ